MIELEEYMELWRCTGKSFDHQRVSSRWGRGLNHKLRVGMSTYDVPLCRITHHISILSLRSESWIILKDVVDQGLVVSVGRK